MQNEIVDQSPESRGVSDRGTDNRGTGNRGTREEAPPDRGAEVLSKRIYVPTLYLYDGTQSGSDINGSKQVAQRIYGATETNIRRFRNWSEFLKIIRSFDQIDRLVIDTHGSSDEFFLTSGSKITIKKLAARFKKARTSVMRELVVEGCVLGLYPADLAILARKMNALTVLAWLMFRAFRSDVLYIAPNETPEGIEKQITNHKKLGPQYIRYLMPGDEPSTLSQLKGRRQIWFEWFDTDGLSILPSEGSLRKLRKLGRYLTRKETLRTTDVFTEDEAESRQEAYDGDSLQLARRLAGSELFSRISMKILRK
jgi:hypothetical protein